MACGKTKNRPMMANRRRLKNSRVLRNRKYESTPVPKRPLILFMGECHRWRQLRMGRQL